jgi:death-on-curing protein
VSEPVWLLETAVLIAHETSIALHGGSPGIRDLGLLESALARPRNLYEYSQADLFELAAAYTVGIVKNHPFVDGNKRAGFLAGAMFLELKGLRFSANEADATQVILALAAGNMAEHQLADFLRGNCAEPG